MIVACLPLVLTALWSHCQEETPQNPDSARTQVDVRVAPERMVEAPIRIERSQDAARFLPLSEDRVRPLEDYLEVPLPIPRVVQAGENGDVLIREASGDPFFLSFAAGDYYPPANELLDPLLVQQLPVPTDGRQGGYTYAFVMFSKVMTDERMGLLESMGCRLLGRYPHYTLRVALPSYLLGDVSTLPFVRWVGIPRSWQKISPHIQSEPSDTNVEGIESFHVSVFESDFNPASTSTPFGGGAQTESGERVASVNGRDQRSKTWMSNGWMQAALEARGVKIRSYNRRLHCFQVRMTRAQMDQVIGLDFVLAVEPVLTPTLASLAPAAPAAPVPHDESVAMIAADAVRPFYGGGFSQTAILGIIDSGVEMDHWDIGGNGTPFGGFATACDPNVSGWDDDVANQGTGHGTHVLGTILGRGVVKVDQRGVAPGLATWGGTSRIFNYRAYAPGNCVHDPGDVTWGPGDLQPIVDWFKLPKTDSLGDTTPKPHVINNSWGRNPSDGQPLVPTGVEYNCRVIDDAVYTDNQLFVFSAGNNGNGTGFLCVEASSKNALTVGNVVDHIPAGVFQEPGSLWAASSRGPCGDGRWKPNLVAPGHLVLSARSDQNQGYKNGTGTSMAAPHVTGVAATLIDHYPSKYAYKPASISALLMATALTKSDLLLGDPNPPGATKNHLNTYGAGRVNSYKAHWDHPSYEVFEFSSVVNNVTPDSDVFVVPANATRLVTVMHYVEPPAPAGVGKALINDFDLWLDEGDDDFGPNTGEHFAHQSQIDNTEIVILDNPMAGPWRWKVFPTNATPDAVQVAVVVVVITGDPTPNGIWNVQVDGKPFQANDNIFLQPGEQVTIMSDFDVDSYIGSAVVLERFLTIPNDPDVSSTGLYDFIVTDLTDNDIKGRSITLGDCISGAPRRGTWKYSYPTQGLFPLTLEARGDNIATQQIGTVVTVDGTDPGPVTNLRSTTHTPGVWSNNPYITWVWDAAVDDFSGIQGYSIWTTNSCEPPNSSPDIGPLTSYTGGPYWSNNLGFDFSIRSVDQCDNYDLGYVCDSNYRIDLDAPMAPTFNSSSHKVGGKSCNPTITVNWNAGTDAHSGVEGYGLYWTSSPTGCRSNVLDTTGTTDTVTLSPGTWYLNVITKDFAGNWTDCANLASFGPFTIVSSCTLFSDDFESGGYAAGGWTISGAGRCKVNANSAFNGAFGARLKKGGQGTGPCTVGVAAKQTWIQAPPVDTTGWSGVRVDMNAHFRKNTLSCEYMDLQWWDGAAWQSAGIVEKHAWAPYSFNLPAGALGNPALSLRLITNSKGKGEKAELDDFAVIGIE